jgi:hypothetical protein
VAGVAGQRSHALLLALPWLALLLRLLLAP